MEPLGSPSLCQTESAEGIGSKLLVGPAKSLKKALYVFSGLKRKSDVASLLTKKGWQAEEFDILRTKKHDLTKLEVFSKLRDRIKAGEFAALLASPPCDI